MEGQAGLMKRPDWRTGNAVAPDERNREQNLGCHGFGVFDMAVSSWFDNMSEDYGFTEDGKTAIPDPKTQSGSATTSSIAIAGNVFAT